METVLKYVPLVSAICAIFTVARPIISDVRAMLSANKIEGSIVVPWWKRRIFALILLVILAWVPGIVLLYQEPQPPSFGDHSFTELSLTQLIDIAKNSGSSVIDTKKLEQEKGKWLIIAAHIYSPHPPQYNSGIYSSVFYSNEIGIACRFSSLDAYEKFVKPYPRQIILQGKIDNVVVDASTGPFILLSNCESAVAH